MIHFKVASPLTGFYNLFISYCVLHIFPFLIVREALAFSDYVCMLQTDTTTRTSRNCWPWRCGNAFNHHKYLVHSCLNSTVLFQLDDRSDFSRRQPSIDHQQSLPCHQPATAPASSTAPIIYEPEEEDLEESGHATPICLSEDDKDDDDDDDHNVIQIHHDEIESTPTPSPHPVPAKV